MNRREFIGRSCPVALAISPLALKASELTGAASRPTSNALLLEGSKIVFTPRNEIIERTNKARPLLGGPVPPRLGSHFGATHFAGKYCLTEEPYIIEGLKKLQGFGFKAAKLWFSAGKGMQSGYGFHSTWPEIAKQTTLADMATMPLFRQAFAMPFETFFLETLANGSEGWRKGEPPGALCYVNEETQIHDLAKYFLETYRDRDVTFVIQNWEGDWMLRGLGVPWENDKSLIPLDIDKKIEGMIRYFQARQRGVERARGEVTGAKARVFHALEINKIWRVKQRTPMPESGVPTLLADVVPHVKPDMVSWSSYDGLWDMPASFWQGIEMIRHYTPPSPILGRNNVVIGEIGFHEQHPDKGREQVREFWDNVVGVTIALKVPDVLHWELYCNEWNVPKGQKVDVALGAPFPTDRLRGFWLIRPDGSDSHAGAYFRELLRDRLE